jgi:hypothetical protein
MRVKKITQINKCIWTNFSLDSFIDLYNFFSCHFPSLKSNGLLVSTFFLSLSNKPYTLRSKNINKNELEKLIYLVQNLD